MFVATVTMSLDQYESRELLLAEREEEIEQLRTDIRWQDARIGELGRENYDLYIQVREHEATIGQLQCQVIKDVHEKGRLRREIAEQTAVMERVLNVLRDAKESCRRIQEYARPGSTKPVGFGWIIGKAGSE